MSETILSINEDAPWRLLSGNRGYWNVALYLRRNIAQQLGLETDQVTVDYNSVAAENGNLFVDQYNTLTYRSEAGYTGSDQITFTYTTSTGETGTGGLDLDIVETGVFGGESTESILFDSNEADNVTGVYAGTSVRLNTDRIGYYGYDFYVTEEEILKYFVDNNGESNLEIEILNANYTTNGSTQDSSVPFEKVADGVWKVSADVIGDSESFSPFTPTNRGINFLFTVTDPDSGDKFSKGIGFQLDPAPAGYSPDAVAIDGLLEENYLLDGINNSDAQKTFLVDRVERLASESFGSELELVSAVGENGDVRIRRAGNGLDYIRINSVDFNAGNDGEERVELLFQDANGNQFVDTISVVDLTGTGISDNRPADNNINLDYPAYVGTDLIMTQADLLKYFSGEGLTAELTAINKRGLALNPTDTPIREENGNYIADVGNIRTSDSRLIASARITDANGYSFTHRFGIFIENVPEDAFKVGEEGLESYLQEQGAGYFRLINGYLVPVDESSLTSETDLVGVYYCDPSRSTDLNAQFMDPTFGDVAPNLGETAPPAAGSYPSGTLFEELCTCVDALPVFEDPAVPFEGYDPINNWKPQRRVEINPGGPAADPLGDEIVINDANGRLFGINNRASDSTFDDITGVAFVMGEEGSFDDGTIAGKEYIGTLEFDLREGYRTTANFNAAQLEPIAGSISPDGTLDGALVSTETGEVLALFESVNVI